MSTVSITLNKTTKKGKYYATLTITNSAIPLTSGWFITCIGKVDKIKHFTVSTVGGQTVLKPDSKISSMKASDVLTVKFSGTETLPTNCMFHNEPTPPGPGPPGPGPPAPGPPAPGPPAPAPGTDIKISLPKIKPPLAQSNLPVKNIELLEYKFPLGGPWGVTKIGWGSEKHDHGLHSIVKIGGTDVLQVNFPKGSYKPDSTLPIRGGIGIYTNPSLISKSNGATLSYDIYFDDNFNPNLGGKLPGLYWGDPTEVSGGKHVGNSSSIRLMWRESIDPTNQNVDIFKGEAYAYISLEQDPSFDLIPGLVKNITYGNSMWRTEFLLHKKQWNHISLTCKLNTSGNADGFISLTMNNVTCSFDKLRFVDDASAISSTGIIAHYFFGGSTENWATQNDTSIYTANFNIEPY